MALLVCGHFSALAPAAVLCGDSYKRDISTSGVRPKKTKICSASVLQ